jgi:hypothetical protein
MTDEPESIWIDRGPNGGWMFRTEKMPDSVRQYIPAPRTDGDDGELVERLNYTHEHGIFDAQIAGMLASPKEAAARITALSAEVERLGEALKKACDHLDQIGEKSDPYLDAALGAKP